MKLSHVVVLLISIVFSPVLSSRPLVTLNEHIRHVAVGSVALVVKGDGNVVAWGNEVDGLAARVPPKSDAWIKRPITIDLPGKALQVAVGKISAYALLENGTVMSWGLNYDGQLGTGPLGETGVLGVNPKPSHTPVLVTGLTNMIQIEAGERFALALKNDGTVWAWGTRDNGVLGDGEPKGLRPVHAIGAVQVPGLTDIIQIAAGSTHSLALRKDGRVMAWGSNNSGELGIGTRFTGWTPAEVLNLENVVQVDAGGFLHDASLALRADGTVWGWGSNAETVMGNGEGPLSPDDKGGRNPLPIQIKGLSNVKAITMGAGHAAALLNDGTLRLWGHDGYGQIGVGTAGDYHKTPTAVTRLKNVKAIYLGPLRSLAVTIDGSLWIWGFRYNGDGVLKNDNRVPTRLELP